MSESQPNVEFYFDPICPWCWMTSRWAAEVSAARGFEITWYPVSLLVINEGNDDTEYVEGLKAGHRMVRVVEAVRASEDGGAVGALYTALGNRIHPGEREDIDAVITEALAEVGLDASYAEAADRTDSDEGLRSRTHHALEIAGPDVGVPVLSVDGVAFFGPVVTPAPQGEQALALWDGIVGAASVPGFFELKRGRTKGPEF